MSSDLKRLVKISRSLGARVAYVQGGGGNTSLKINNGNMLIKASGKLLVNIDEQTGFLPVDWKSINSSIHECKTNADYDAMLMRCLLSDDKSVRPSIETGLHAKLGKCVIHTHSVWANLLTCSREGKKIMSDLFKDAIWVPYATPGLALTRAVEKRVKTKKNVIVFLQNHGILVSAENEEAALARHEAVTASIRIRFSELKEFDEDNTDQFIVDLNGMLFPDQVVYNSDPFISASSAGRETLRAYYFLKDRIERAGLTLNYIHESEKEILLNLNSEKYRQELVNT